MLGRAYIFMTIVFSGFLKAKYEYENMFITGADRFHLWVDGTPVENLKFWDYWPYPDRVEMRSDVGLVAVRVHRNIKAGAPHALMSWSNSGRYSTDTVRWQCQDYLEDSEIYEWFKPNFVSLSDWHHALKLGWNDDFEDQTNPWNGPVRLIPSSAIWIGCQLSAKSDCYCLLNLRYDFQDVDDFHFLNQELFKRHLPITFPMTLGENHTKNQLYDKLVEGRQSRNVKVNDSS